MLNTQLIAEFQGIARENRTGSLTVATGTDTRRFYFEDGQLMLMDLCTDKELLLARTFVDFHKIDEAMHQLACQLYRQNGTKIAETLEKQRVVHGEESAYVQRSMVEQVLVSLFSTDHQSTDWKNDDDDSIEPYDLDVSALKIKIDTNMLVTMAQTRIQEREAVASAIGDFGYIIGLTEVDASGMQLNEMEMNVLRMVDGLKSIRDLARSMRDSTQNIACYIKSLIDHGLVKLMEEKPATGSRVMQAMNDEALQQQAVGSSPQEKKIATTQVGAAPRPNAGQQPQAQEFSVYTESYARQQGGGGGGRLLLIMVVLVGVVLAGGIGFLVVKARETKQMIDELQYQLAQDFDKSAWSTAEEHVKEAFTVAGTDVVLRDSLQSVCNNYQQILAKKFDQVSENIATGNLDVAQVQLGKMPTDIPTTSRIWDAELTQRLIDLRGEYRNGVEAMIQERSHLIDTIDLLLNSGASRDAVATVEGIENEDLKVEFKNRLAEWRENQLTEVKGAERMSVSARLRMLERIEGAQPTEDELKIIDEERQRLADMVARVRTTLTKARETLGHGDLQAVKGILGTLEQQIRDEDLRAEMNSVRRELTDLEDNLNKAQQRLRQAIGEEMRAVGLQKTAAAVRQQFAAQPALLEDPALAIPLSLVDRVAEIADLPTMDEEVKAIQTLIAEGEPSAQALEMLELRKDSIASTIKQANDALQEARNLLQSKRAGLAKERYAAIIDQVVWQRTAVVGIAKQEIADAEALIIEQEKDREELYQAMREGDVVGVRTLAGKLGMDSLPLYITSKPSGAEILLKGKVIGKTPMLLKNLESTERADASFTFNLPGYVSQSIDALHAKAGWHIDALLERSALASINVKQQLTAEPAAIDGLVYLAGGRGIFSVPGDGSKFSMYWMQVDDTTAPPRLGNPVYAPVIKRDGMLQVTTRDRLVLSVDEAKGTVARRGIPSETNLPVSIFHSELIVDRVLDIVVNLDHGLEAFDRRSTSVVWTYPSTVPVACKPLIVGRMLLVAYQDGRLLSLDADNGNLLAENDIGDNIAAAWADGDELIGYAGNIIWRWNGEELQQTDLPFQAIGGGPGIVLTNERRVHIGDASGWTLVGVARDKLSGRPVRWGDHVALVSQHEVQVLGARPFTITSVSDMLLPCVVGDNLAVVSSDGMVRIYAP